MTRTSLVALKPIYIYNLAYIYDDPIAQWLKPNKESLGPGFNPFKDGQITISTEEVEGYSGLGVKDNSYLGSRFEDDHYEL